MKENIILIGGGGHCKSCIDVIEQEGRFHIAGIIDKVELIGQEVLGYKIIGTDDDLEALFKKYKYAFITIGHIGSTITREKLFYKAIEIGFEIPKIISPRAYVSDHSQIEHGTIIMHDALVNANVKIGKNCIINTKALIEHDAMIDDDCHISTGAIINGGVIVKAKTFVGSHATSKEYIEVSGFIKAGSIVK